MFLCESVVCHREETTRDTRWWWTVWSTISTSYPAASSTRRPSLLSVRLIWPFSPPPLRMKVLLLPPAVQTEQQQHSSAVPLLSRATWHRLLVLKVAILLAYWERLAHAQCSGVFFLSYHELVPVKNNKGQLKHRAFKNKVNFPSLPTSRDPYLQPRVSSKIVSRQLLALKYQQGFHY